MSLKNFKNKNPNREVVESQDTSQEADKLIEHQKKNGDDSGDNVILPKHSMIMNDWFDPVFIQKKLEFLKLCNQLESEDGGSILENSRYSHE